MTTVKAFLASRGAKWAYLALGLCFAFFVALNDFVLPWYVHSRGTVTVPSVVGMQFVAAKAMLDSLGLECRKGDTRQDNEHAEGMVIVQNPLEGIVVKRGRRVYLTVSGGEILGEVPNIKGRTLRDAKFALEHEGIKLGTIQYLPSDQYPLNTVMDQGVPPGTKLKRGKYVSVVISQGSVAEKVTVPDLRGKTLADVQKILTQVNLRLGNVTYIPSVELLPNTVVDHFPAAGALVPNGQPVDLVVVQAGEKSKQLFEN
jgi:serine/threonine-protein kinase